MNDFFAVIPAGGVGSRLWPLSRADSPKFLHDLSGDGKTLIRATWDRLRGLVSPDHIFVVAGRAHGDAIRSELPEIPSGNLLLEPEPRDSAAAIGFAVLHVLRQNPEAIIGSFAADHVISDDHRFLLAIRSAITRAREGKIVTIGIRPTEPSTAFGYIQVDSVLAQEEGLPRSVVAFVEKPTYEKATEFLGLGSFFWNAGMFIAKASVMWEFYQESRPELARGLATFYESYLDGDEESARMLWGELNEEAIDYVVAEPAAEQGRMEMVIGQFDWDDVGDFAALAKLHKASEEDRVIVLGSNAKVVAQDSTGVVVSQSRRLVSLIGIQDIIVVDMPDALLITTKNHAQDVKKMVEHMKLEGLDEVL